MSSASDISSELHPTPLSLSLRGLAFAAAGVTLFFIINNFLIFWHGWPGIDIFFAHYGVLGLEPLTKPLEGATLTLGWVQFLVYLGIITAAFVYAFRTPSRSLYQDSLILDGLTAYIIRSAFWSILLIGIVDMTLSFMRVEGFLESLFGLQTAQDLGRASYRGAHFHYPLIGLGFIIGIFNRSLGFTWLALLIVLAELLIVITRFVFSYEQAFMGDLVRFWYAGLFLFASAYTLIEEGHVRVDILYTGFTERGKAWANTFGSLVLGIPVCWIILIYGMWAKSNLINAPLLSYEVTQNGYGMFVKYIMAGFLMVYAVSMIIQFLSYFLSNSSVLLDEPDHRPEHDVQAEHENQAV